MRNRSLVIRSILVSSAGLVVLAASACTTYYKVTDTGGSRSYYTTSIDRDRKTSVVRFKDAKTDSEITLPSSEVKEISKSEYKEAVNAK